jgi:hypothetical protein
MDGSQNKRSSRMGSRLGRERYVDVQAPWALKKTSRAHETVL